ncbi:bifunctional aspartate kinase/diaminopimelate decarboxylase [Wenzhouxiangella limi]|uniref:aspartate kinase n=1 Tax=Wenzhouxiangella limi TaxID=2707351 RepID=A0A845VGV6_9GAMM|nr:bifunctional aspartate kinase/diaminopimelate decarboxylase [Wenzhouxiangella limi]NDY96439.1 bifunctional aspartate kinase/diaminopimelate decarboxylase [Wenzhouxiangella limi]
MQNSDSNRAVRWRVLKFGGSAVARSEHWPLIAQCARNALAEGAHLVIVVSALRGMTDLLQAQTRSETAQPVEELIDQIKDRHLALARALAVPEPNLAEDLEHLRSLLEHPELGDSPAVQAELLAQGEQLSSRLAVAILAAQGIDGGWLDARHVLTCPGDAGRTATSEYLSAHCPAEPDRRLQAQLAARGRFHIMPGFLAANARGETVLLGRGGSDTSATCTAALLEAERVEIHSDVPGLFSADPRRIPAARLLKLVSYREAQELAAMGAKALHPRSLIPVARDRIPLWLCQVDRPDITGTRITPDARDHGAQVKAIVQRKGMTLIALEGLGMWQQVGFLADIFAEFKALGLSVDQVSTSESNVTVTLDPGANLTDQAALRELSRRLEKHCKVEILTDCATVSLVGLGIRTILHRLGPALEVFEQRRIFQVSQAANDLNLTFVVESRHADRLVQQLHQQVIPGGVGGDSVFGPTWEQLFREDDPVRARPAWWRRHAGDLIELLGQRECAYVYNLTEVRRAASRLLALRSVDRVLYSMKANPHPAILATLVDQGLGIECVSVNEARHALACAPGLRTDDLLLTTNFAGREEFRQALAMGLQTTVDNLYILEHWGHDLAGREIFLRLDPGSGLGHHKMVRTAGSHAKFGIPLYELERAQRLAEAHDIRITGLHAHTGSGILHPDNWQRTLQTLGEAARELDEVRVINLGGGLGVPDRADQQPLDLAALDAGLQQLKHDLIRPVQVWLEPGRYLVSEAGVLLARINQTKGKGEVRYVGIATGMNSLIRPALYGAWHEIVNLTRLDEPGEHVYNVVGPICETGDILGLDRLLPDCREGDVVLIANTGAYGAAMASRYNLREPAEELTMASGGNATGI